MQNQKEAKVVLTTVNSYNKNMFSKINPFKRIRFNNFVGGLIFGALKKTSDKQCIQAFNYFFILGMQSAKRVFDQSLETLKVFHPTKDRMQSPILRFLMGDKSIGALSQGGVQE